jgi:hypothetical protein
LSGTLRISAFALVVAFLSCPALAQNRLAEFRSRFQRETDPVHRAKVLPQLGTAQFQEIDKDLAADKLPDALSVLQQYRDEAQSCAKALDAKSVNAEKHPSGFKELELSLRESLRRLDDILVSFPPDEQGAFRVVRNDLDELDRHMIRELFPNQGDKDTHQEKPRD